MLPPTEIVYIYQVGKKSNSSLGLILNITNYTVYIWYM